MNKLKLLEVKKLLKELEYIESDFEYRSQAISEADSEFIGCVNSFLSSHPDLKEIYDKKITDQINQNIKDKAEENVNVEEVDIDTEEISEDDSDDETPDETYQEDQEEKTIENISPKMKKLYREIVKLTHPDKVKKKKLNDIYLKATTYYDAGDKVGIYKICSELDIDYEIEDDDKVFISTKIDSLKRQIGFLESTFTWMWYRTEDKRERDQIMINYIKLRIQ